jgi:DNA-binding response OmpR family regulator
MKFPRASAPSRQTGDPTDASESAQPPPPAPQMPARSIRVLVVEDEEQLARMARIVLSQHGHDVSVASSGDEAIERLQYEQFDLVISDLGLGPGKNGWDVGAATREHWPGTRFVLVTGWGAAIDPAEARLRGVDEIVAKPYRIADLRQIADHVADTVNNG